ncbi:MAG: ribosomal L7Ae/L30e/S12e/Gadd45 family protein [Peptococcaceae bacterium]|nr:ribosomal L7Ae/L30e/S12e/Gadd45 family protein [Peptococcaceae bacterium]
MSVGKLIGLGQRAGRLVSGEFAVKSALAGRRAKLLVIAGDAAERTRRELFRLAGSANVPAILYGSKEELGRLTGKPPRSAVAFTDEQMARGVLGAMERGEVNRT